MPNRLIDESSPYLQQHAHNPVDWYPWCDEAFERAASEDKPVLLSIGYSACHWCHVMERESFENEEIARLMNESFVSIKVDREERPDLDSVYMSAVQALTGQGGWPMTVFLTPDKRPFFGGTYFPPEDRANMPGFARVLQTVADAYRNRRGEVETAAREIVSHLNQPLQPQQTVEPLTADILDLAAGAAGATHDQRNGGFGTAPKFPQPMTLEFLLRRYYHTGDEDSLATVQRTLDKMARGGIYDQIGGGFHRYSVDARWLVPHFEKMLYDNALLSRVYLHAYLVTGKPLYRRIVEETLDYVLREMTDTGGGFYSTQDADSEGVEGRYYTWTMDELREALGVDDAKLAARCFGAIERGNFEGTNILHRPVESEALAPALGMSTEELEARTAAIRERLLDRRARRVPPHRDDKVLADWNGMMLASFAEAAAVLGRADYLQAAVANASFVTDTMCAGDTLNHVWKDGKAKIDGYLSDYALVADGLLALYRATLDERWLAAATQLVSRMLQLFWDEGHGVFYDAARNGDGLFARPRDIFDNTVPSGSSAASSVLLRLSRLTGNREYERVAAANLRSVREYMHKYPTGFGNWLCALDFYLADHKEIAIVGEPEDPATLSLLREVQRRYLPDLTLAGGNLNGSASAVALPPLRDKAMVDGRPTAYLCHRHTCRPPVTEPEALAALLDSP